MRNINNKTAHLMNQFPEMLVILCKDDLDKYSKKKMSRHQTFTLCVSCEDEELQNLVVYAIDLKKKKI